MSVEAGSLFVIGNPLLDISGEVDKAWLDRYGLEKGNAYLAEEKHAGLYKDLAGRDDVEYIGGGAAQNTARGVQWMVGGAASKGCVTYVGSVGKDAFGSRLRQLTEGEGVTTVYDEHPDESTGLCAVGIFDKERTLVARLDAAAKFRREHFDTAAVQEALKKAKIVYTTGFFITSSFETLEALGKQCQEEKKTLVLNLSAPFVMQFYKEQVSKVLPYTDIVICNESEAQAYADAFELGKGDAGIAAMIKHVSTFGDRRRTVVVTQGSSPTLTLESTAGADDKPKQHSVMPVPAEEIIDSNGAGDSFVAGFLSQLLAGKSLDDAVQAGHYLGSRMIRVAGTKFTGEPDLASYKAKLE